MVKKKDGHGELKHFITSLCILLVGAGFLITGCGLDTTKEDVGQSVEFTVVSPEEIPKELAGILDANKESEMMLSYRIEDYFYLIRGYGKQDTGGYSITVNHVVLKDDGIHVNTRLLGPAAGEEIPKEPSCPYVVVKTEYMEKQVIFD